MAAELFVGADGNRPYYWGLPSGHDATIPDSGERYPTKPGAKEGITVRRPAPAATTIDGI